MAFKAIYQAFRERGLKFIDVTTNFIGFLFQKSVKKLLVSKP